MIDIKELQKQVIEDYQSGMLCGEIADKYDLYIPVVSFLLKAADIKVNQHRIKYGMPIKEKINLPIERIVRMYKSGQYDIFDLSIEFNVSTTTIVNRLKEAGITMRRPIPKKKLENVDPEIIRQLYWDKKLTTEQIGEMYHVTGMTIGNFMKEHNIPRRKGGRGQK